MLLDNRNFGQMVSDVLTETEQEGNRRLRKLTLRKTAESILRKIGFLTVSLFLRWPIWILLGIARFFKPFDYLFLVYPGDDSDLDGYCPRWLAKSWLFSTKPTIAGVISKGSGGRGLVLVVPNTASDFQANKETCQAIVRRLKRISSWIGAPSIALAGQAPGMITRHGVSFEEPFVRGNKGAVFCVAEVIEEVMQKHNLVPGQFKITLVGVGYVGNLLMSFLEEEGHDVEGIDIRNHRNRVSLQEDAPTILNQADMIIVLTPKGSDFIPYLPYLKEGAIVIDDTHPRIRKKLNDITFYKVAVGMKGVNFTPRLPGYKSDWIPGCAVEAMVSAKTGDFNGDTSSRMFHKQAREMGFYAHLVA